jgi:signal transduction histidine kinase
LEDLAPPVMLHDDALATARMRSLARLARPTAHELRGALSALYIHLELLAGALDGDDTAVCERRQRHLEVVREECRRLQRIVDAFLTLAALPDGAAELDLGVLVNAVVEAVRPLAAARRVRLEAPAWAPGGCTGPQAEGCRQRLLDVLLDALVAARPGSTVHVDPVPDGRSVRVQGADGACVDVTLPAPEERTNA